MLIRPTTHADHPAIRDVDRLAFGRDDEADLVEALRRDGDVLVELSALIDGRVVGHVLFSALGLVRGPETVAATALAPVAVAPDVQRQGIGAALVAQGVEACRAAGAAAVVVLGHPDYYPRFGFSADLAVRLRAPFSGPAFMAIELVPGALASGAAVRYAAAFGLDPASDRS